jgi:transposase
MVEPEVLRHMRALAERGWGSKSIAHELGIARNTVRRYLRGGSAAEAQVRPKARRLDDEARANAARLLETTAEGNAVVVRDLLGVKASVRTIQRAVASRRRELRAALVASVRFETAPGQQMQIDFGEKWVVIAGVRTKVHLLAAVLSHSRRTFTKAFLCERGDDWREGVACAFRHFGGVTRTVLGDNAKALVLDHNRRAQTVVFHLAYLAFCKDWDVEPRACAPFRARTKGKVESGVKYVKRNALAGRSFESFAALEAHLVAWMRMADEREHGTTHERPIDRFERVERVALRPLPARPLVVREQRLGRKVANDALVDVATVRYSVPHNLVGEVVEVHVGETTVKIEHAGKLVATHVRSNEPHARVVDQEHWKGLWRAASVEDACPPTTALAQHGRSLDVYAAVVEGRAS